MKPAYRKPAKSAKRETDEMIGKSRTEHRWFDAVLEPLGKRFPTKLAAELAYRANRSERICEKWIARRGSPDGEALTALLNSDIGDMVWKALTENCAHPWAAKMRKQMLASELRDQLRAAADQLKSLEEGL